MATTPLVSTVKSNNSDEIETNEQVSLLQSAERLLQSGQTNQENSSNATFAVLKATALQQAIGHPLSYARVLMQLGYEPLPAYRGKTFFGKETLFYPNVFRYLKYIYNIDGWTGLYRGFGCSLLSKMICWYTTIQIDRLLDPIEPSTPNDQEPSTWNRCIKKTLREVRCQSWGILISHPFQVMAIRSMGQFIGHEQMYSSINIFQNFHEIYQRQGLGGFFVGLIPRWLLESSMIIISNVLIHLLKSQLPTQKEMIPLYEYMASFISQTVTYPLSVVSTVIAINQSGLRAGMLPIAPIYVNWQDAYNQLSETEQLKRGSSLFNRAVFSGTGIPALGTPIPNA